MLDETWEVTLVQYRQLYYFQGQVHKGQYAMYLQFCKAADVSYKVLVQICSVQDRLKC